MQDLVATSADAGLLTRAQQFLTRRGQGRPSALELEVAWETFYRHCSSKMRRFAFTCGVTEADVADCTQEVWAELLRRLPTFRLDPGRGAFDTWLFRIVRGKAADLCRARKRRSRQERAEVLRTAIDPRPNSARSVEAGEMAALLWQRLRGRLSDCNLQVLRMRLLEQRPVAEVARALGLSHEQVWYRYHRALREATELGASWACAAGTPRSPSPSLGEENGKAPKFAQGEEDSGVSRVGYLSLGCQGGSCVDYVFQRLELGRRELTPEWKVEWHGDGMPRPVLYLRKTAIVAYAEICSPADFLDAHWPRIVQAAIAAGVAAGVATIIATPGAALPVFRAEFQRQLQSKGGSVPDEKIQVALSARPEPNGSWSACKE